MVAVYSLAVCKLGPSDVKHRYHWRLTPSIGHNRDSRDLQDRSVKLVFLMYLTYHRASADQKWLKVAVQHLGQVTLGVPELRAEPPRSCPAPWPPFLLDFNLRFPTSVRFECEQAVLIVHQSPTPASKATKPFG